MTKVKFRINKIQLYSSERRDVNDDTTWTTFSLPFATKYKTAWLFKFECGACREIIHYDNSSKHSGKSLDCLFEPYYSKERLRKIASLFENMKVFSSLEEPDKLYLTYKTYIDRNSSALLIPKVRLRHNSCPSCKIQILYWINNESPRPPSREYHNSAPGFLRINEIIGIDMDDESVV